MSGLPEGLYDANAAAPVSGQDRLEQAQHDDAARRLDAALARVSEHVALAREQELRDGLDESTLAMLENLTAREDAPLEWRSLHDRVASGRTTWERIWADPGAEAGGRRLVLDVISAQATAAAAARVLFEAAAARGEHDAVPGTGARG